jgi:ABC-type amino acid transport substrate-binding protein
VVIIENPPFIILRNPAATYAGMTDQYKRIDINEFDGFFKDVMLSLQGRMEFVPIVMLAKPTTPIDALVEGVANSLFDIVMTTVSITTKRNKIVDFSKSLLPRSIRVIIRRPTSVRLDFLFFLKPFSWELWLLVLGTIAYTSLLLWYFDGQNGIARSVSHAFHVVFNRNSSSAESTTAVQFLTFGLHVLYIILFAVYTASLLSFIIIQNSKPSISGIDDIRNGKIPPNRIGIVVGSAIENFYLKSVSEGINNYFPLKAIQEVYTSLINGAIDAALWSNHSTVYHVNNVYCDLMTVGVEFGHSSYQMPVKNDWL